METSVQLPVRIDNFEKRDRLLATRVAVASGGLWAMVSCILAG